jgi:hypothetical protein
MSTGRQDEGVDFESSIADEKKKAIGTSLSRAVGGLLRDKAARFGAKPCLAALKEGCSKNRRLLDLVSLFA